MRTLVVTDRDEIDGLIRSCRTCFLAMSLDDQPYVLPMNFALDGDVVILHSAMQGRMWETLLRNPKVCLTWTAGEELAWQDIRVGCSYRVKSASVVGEGVAEVVSDEDEKYQCMLKLMAQYSHLVFRFSKPSVRNVGVIRVHIGQITARRFGVSVKQP